MPPDAAGQPGRAHARLLLVLAGLVPALVLLAHAAIIPLGTWHPDEFFLFALYREVGLRALYNLIFHLNARPLVEPLIYLYWRLTEAFHRPLIPEALAFAWTLLWTACLVPAWLAPAGGAGRAARLVFALSLLALFIVGHDSGELFYWPLGGITYLPMLAAMSLHVFLILDGRTATPAGRAGTVGVLVAVASCMQTGLLYAALFSVLWAAAEGLRWRRGQALRGAGRVLLCAAPAAYAAFLLGLILAGQRLTLLEMPVSPASYRHHLLASLGAAVSQFGRELVSLQGDGPIWHDAGLGLATKLLFFAAVRLLWCRLPRPATYRPAEPMLAAVAFLAASYLTIASAYYQFGWLCCERHQGSRQCMIFLSLALVAVWSVRLRPRRPAAPVALQAGPVLLAASVALASIDRMPALRAEAAIATAARRAHAETWASGMRKDATGMTWFRTPLHRVVTGDWQPAPGRYHLSADQPWYLEGIFKYFDKRDLLVVPPS